MKTKAGNLGSKHQVRLTKKKEKQKLLISEMKEGPSLFVPWTLKG